MNIYFMYSLEHHLPRTIRLLKFRIRNILPPFLGSQEGPFNVVKRVK
jgi:hypothetical protein